MRWQLHKHKVSVSHSLEKAIHSKVDKIKTRLKRYHPDVADLNIKLEHQENGKEYECNLILKAFRETLTAKKRSPELRVAVDKCFDAMMKELDHYRVKLNKSLSRDDGAAIP